MIRQLTPSAPARGTTRRTTALAGLLAVAVPGVVLFAAAAASAADSTERTILGPLAIAPVEGDLRTPITMTTGGGCPQGTNTLTRVFGPGFPDIGENVVGNSETIEFGSPPADRMVVPMTITLEEAVRRQKEPMTPDGEYRIVLTCQDPMPGSAQGEYGDYVGTLRIGADGRYSATTTAAELPDPPAPKAGPDSLALVPLAPAPSGAPDPVAEPVTQDSTATSAGSKSSAGALPYAASGGILLAGVGGALLYARRPVKGSTGSKP